jgi:tRNA nucleotidyltransferase (CCA-adding enzyme)
MERLKDHPKLTGPTVAQVMSRPVLTMPADTRLCDAVKQIRKEHKGAYPILEGERAVGIVTRTDFYRALLSFCEPETRITSLMSKPLLTVRDSAPLSEAVREFIRHPVKHLVVVSEDGSPVGMLTPFDVLEFLVG